MFRRVLVANRGEIACRVIRTLRRLGIASVAVYSEADEAALHVAMADAAVPIGPPPARDSYLVIDRIIAAARASGAEAIHPGYGFLSENPALAHACDDAGIMLIGPPAAALRAMSLKRGARDIAAAAGVPVLPGQEGDDQSAAALAEAAEAIGYPVMIKAVAGGGGRGMRRVDAVSGFAKALAAAQREALAAFADDRVLVEKFLPRPRHVEIQVAADGRGGAVHLFERDCSIQRRHQKILEESPSPGLPEAMRAAMAAAALALVRAVDYVGVGTIEFIADASDGLRPDRFWFLEMNTRLQVEHPVTEMLTGIDLVEWQVRIAAGEPLPLAQEAIIARGHAIEARLCAENPEKHFLPSPGTLSRFDLPAEDAGVRCDVGVRAGDTVTPWYDSLLGKLIVHAPTRAAALARMAAALAQVRIEGVAGNARLLGAVVAHPAFAAGDIDTGFLDRHRTDLLAAAAAPPDLDPGPRAQ
jgi:3-methylcrotonyl-CoA carboxylase alpha subunit